MTKYYNLINIVILGILAYAIVVAEVSSSLKSIAWVLWGIVAVFSLVKFHLNWKKRKIKM